MKIENEPPQKIHSLKRVELRVSNEMHDILRKISYDTRESINYIINTILVNNFKKKPEKTAKK